MLKPTLYHWATTGGSSHPSSPKLETQKKKPYNIQKTPGSLMLVSLSHSSEVCHRCQTHIPASNLSNPILCLQRCNNTTDPTHICHIQLTWNKVQGTQNETITVPGFVTRHNRTAGHGTFKTSIDMMLLQSASKPSRATNSKCNPSQLKRSPLHRRLIIRWSLH